jgi:hypothetical protein
MVCLGWGGPVRIALRAAPTHLPLPGGAAPTKCQVGSTRGVKNITEASPYRECALCGRWLRRFAAAVPPLLRPPQRISLARFVWTIFHTIW